jgi:peptidoglycan/xylan/chitin deacetylase (PgdA/CDA1 family)
MIGVIASSHPAWVVEEFFQLFKTPWEPWQAGRTYDVVIAVGTEVTGDAAPLVIVMGAQSLALDLRQGVDLAPLASGSVLTDGDEVLPLYGEAAALPAQPGAERLGVVDGRAVALRARRGEHTFIRLGYDLFEETRRILTDGQPVEHAATPTLDLHVNRLRRWMGDTELTFLEIPPVPHGHPFIVSLTHDIDFIGIRRHFGDHTMLGFLYRATLGSGRDFLRGRLAFGRLCRNWLAVAKLPFVYLRLARDFWVPFPWLLEVETGLSATYYLIPFKGRPGAKVKSAHPERRATGYDVTDMAEWAHELTRAGCEIGVHGIDAWHDPAAGRAERERVAGVSGTPATGIRMHWLEFGENSYRALEEAGYAYDSTMGFNETVGYRHGTAQVFRPPGAAQLLELPMHIQDGSLFYPSRLNLSEREAHERCAVLVRQAERTGGVLTVLWHDRSHAPDRNWGDFYRELVAGLKQRGAWFATAGQVVNWFRQRRAARFVERDGQVRIEGIASTGLPPFVVRVHRTDGVSDEAWIGAEARTVALPGAGVAQLHAA